MCVRVREKFTVYQGLLDEMHTWFDHKNLSHKPRKIAIIDQHFPIKIGWYLLNCNFV